MVDDKMRCRCAEDGTIRRVQMSYTYYEKVTELNIYEYLKYLLTEIPKHMDDTGMDFM